LDYNLGWLVKIHKEYDVGAFYKPRLRV